MVMAQSLFLTLKQTHPSCRIDVLAPDWSFSLLARMPEVSNKITMPVKHGEFGLLARWRLGRLLRAQRYDQAIILPNSWKSALAPFFAGIKIRTGYIGESRWGLLNDARKLDKTLLSMTVQRFVALGLPQTSPNPPAYPIPALLVGTPQQHAVSQKFDVDRTTKILALCPGAEFGTAKRWPIDHYADIALQKLTQGWQVWLFGSEKDQAIAAQINLACNNRCTDFSGRTNLAEAVDLMSLAHTVISNDSGLMHVAAALDKNLIALFGSSDPNFTPPLNSKAKILHLNLTCSPCFQRECPLYPPAHEAHAICLAGIKPEEVIELIE